METSSSPELAVSVLAGSEIAWLCTLRPDGSPHLTPVWFVFGDDRCWVCATTASVKARNLRADPRVSVAVGDGIRPVVLEGRARLYEEQVFPLRICQVFAEKYDGWDIRTLEQGRWERMLAEIPVERWLLAGVPQ